MNGTYIEYARNVGKLGEAMNKTGDKFREVSIGNFKTLGDVSRAKEQYMQLIREFKSQKRKLSNLIVPTVINKEHSILENSYDKYIQATQMMCDSLDIKSLKPNRELFDKGAEQQLDAAKIISETAMKIADILFPEQLKK